MVAQITRCYTLSEALERAAMQPPSNASASRTAEESWAGASYEDAMRMAYEGDPRSARLLKVKAGALAKSHTGLRAVQMWGVAGSAIDMGRYLSGEPECMIETVRARRPSPVIKLGIERTVSSGISTDEMASTGVSVLAAVEALRLVGVPSEVWVTFTQAQQKKLSVQVLIQEAGRPIDIDRLAFWVVHPSALRRVGFAIQEQEPIEDRILTGILDAQSYGYPAEADKGDFDEWAPAQSYQVTEWLARVMLRRGGIQIEED